MVYEVGRLSAWKVKNDARLSVRHPCTNECAKHLPGTPMVQMDRPGFCRHPVAIIHGDDRGVYYGQAYTDEFKARACRDAASTGGDPASAMAQAIQGQVDRGQFISAHRRSNGVDYRTRDLSGKERSSVRSVVGETGGVSLTEGDHIHAQY